MSFELEDTRSPKILRLKPLTASSIIPVEEPRMVKRTVRDTAVSYYSRKGEDYISLTNMARYRNSERVDNIIPTWTLKA